MPGAPSSVLVRRDFTWRCLPNTPDVLRKDPEEVPVLTEDKHLVRGVGIGNERPEGVQHLSQMPY